MEAFPQIAILILNWNNYLDTSACLESLEKLTYPNKEIILVDNGSDDGSLERLREYSSRATIITSADNLGFAGGNNLGLSYVLNQGIPFTLLLNNDTEIAQVDFLEQLTTEILSDESICAVGPKIRRLDGNPDQVILPFPTLFTTIQTTLGLYDPNLNTRQIVDSLKGCCVLVRSSAVNQVGLLDDNYFLYVEETEWFFRMRKAGWKLIYLPIESVIHKVGSSAKMLPIQDVYIERRANVIYTLVKHGLTIQAAITSLFMILLLFFRTVTGVLVSIFTKQNHYSLGMLTEMGAAIKQKWQLARQVNQRDGNFVDKEETS
jgi:GT2 family glycosyltransferase